MKERIKKDYLKWTRKLLKTNLCDKKPYQRDKRLLDIDLLDIDLLDIWDHSWNETKTNFSKWTRRRES